MRKSIFYTFLVSILLLSFSCSKKNENNSKTNNSKTSNSINNLLNGKVTLTGEKPYYYAITITPLDKNQKNEDKKDVVDKENVSEVSFTLPNYTKYIHLGVASKDDKKKLEGYIEINGKKKNFTVTGWGFAETYCLCEFN